MASSPPSPSPSPPLLPRPAPLLLSLLLLVSLGLLGTNASEVKVMGGNTFESDISKGVWFIEFYAPWCGYCKQLIPVWKQLAEGLKDQVNVATMDCTVPENQPICQKHRVRGFPTLKLFADGAHIMDYEGMRNYEGLSSFAVKAVEYAEKKKKHLEEMAEVPKAPQEGEGQPQVIEILAEEQEEEVKREEQKEARREEQKEVRREARRGEEKKPAEERRPNQGGQVVELTSDNFDSLVNSGPWFVDFFAPWCGHCKKLTPVWNELALKLRNIANVGSIDCDAQPAICSKFGVNSYPTLRFFLDGHIHEYRDKRGLENLVLFAKRMTRDPLEEADLARFEELKAQGDVFFIFCHDGQKPGEFEEIAKKYISIGEFHTTSDPALIKQLGVERLPALVSSQNGELSIYSGSLASKTSVDNWVQEHRYPLFGEFSSNNAQALLNTKAKLVMLVTDPIHESFNLRQKPEMIKAATQYARERAKSVPPREVVHFVYINGVAWANYVNKNYEVFSSDLPSLIIIDSDESVYYNINSAGLRIDAKDILRFVGEVQAGKHEGKSVGGWLRGAINSLQKKITPMLEFVSKNLAFVLVGVILVTLGMTFLMLGSGPGPKTEKAE